MAITITEVMLDNSLANGDQPEVFGEGVILSEISSYTEELEEEQPFTKQDFEALLKKACSTKPKPSPKQSKT